MEDISSYLTNKSLYKRLLDNKLFPLRLYPGYTYVIANNGKILQSFIDYKDAEAFIGTINDPNHFVVVA